MFNFSFLGSNGAYYKLELYPLNDTQLIVCVTSAGKAHLPRAKHLRSSVLLSIWPFPCLLLPYS